MKPTMTPRLGCCLSANNGAGWRASRSFHALHNDLLTPTP